MGNCWRGSGWGGGPCQVTWPDMSRTGVLVAVGVAVAVGTGLPQGSVYRSVRVRLAAVLFHWPTAQTSEGETGVTAKRPLFTPVSGRGTALQAEPSQRCAR